MSFTQGQSPMRKVNAGGKKKTIAGEDTDIIKTDKKGKDYALSMFNQASGKVKPGSKAFNYIIVFFNIPFFNRCTC